MFAHIILASASTASSKLCVEYCWVCTMYIIFVCIIWVLQSCRFTGPQFQWKVRRGRLLVMQIFDTESRNGWCTCSRGGCPVSSSLLSSFLAFWRKLAQPMRKTRTPGLYSFLEAEDATFLCGASMSYIAFSTIRASSSSPRCLKFPAYSKQKWLQASYIFLPYYSTLVRFACKPRVRLLLPKSRYLDSFPGRPQFVAKFESSRFRLRW